MPIKDVQEWGVLRVKFDVCGWRGRGGWVSGGPKFRHFAFFADVINE